MICDQLLEFRIVIKTDSGQQNPPELWANNFDQLIVDHNPAFYVLKERIVIIDYRDGKII